MSTDAADDIFGSVGIPYDAVERIPDFIQIRRAQFQEARGGTGVVAGGCDRVENFVSQRGRHLSQDAHAIYMREIRLQLAKPLVLLLSAFAFRRVDVRGDHFHKFSIRREQRAAGRFDIFDRSLGKYNSERERELSFLAQGLLELYIHSLAIIWMYPLQYRFPLWEAVQRVKTPDR